MVKVNFSALIAKTLNWQFAFFLLIIVLCTVLQYTGMKPLLRYDRALVDAGQWYRLITANFIHLNTSHLLLNMPTTSLVMFFFSRHISVGKWILLLLMSCLFVSIGLYVLNPEVKSYVGLSGVLHGLFIVGAYKELKHFPVSGWLLLGVFAVKLAWEQMYGAMPGSESVVNGVVLVDSHLYGAIAGVAFIAILYIFDGKKR